MNYTITSFHKGLLRKEFSCFEFTEKILKEAEACDKKIDAFLHFTPELALEISRQIDLKIAEGEPVDILAGAPLSVKDNILIKDAPATAASKILENHRAVYDATVIKKIKSRGGVIIGKTNLDEFAMGSSVENSAFKKTKNPFDLERVPGGSSGGSAASVAAGQVIYSLGSDTGGSIRQPAAFCKAVGLKPTYGSVSRWGLIAMASSLDQIGPITKTVEDAKIVFEAIKGCDSLDSTSVCCDINKSPAVMELEDLKKIKIGLPKEYYSEGLDRVVAEQIEEVIEVYKSFGCKFKEVNLCYTRYAIPCYYIIMSAEASSNLARYDGIRYGLSERENKGLLEIYKQTKGRGFGKEARRRIIMGIFVLSSGYYEAYYLKAQKVRRLISEEFEKVFKEVDVLLTPTTPTAAFKFGEKAKDPLSMYLSDIYTVSANLAGLPAIAVPAHSGLLSQKIPVSFQLIGRHFDEKTILDLGIFYERAVH